MAAPSVAFLNAIPPGTIVRGDRDHAVFEVKDGWAYPARRCRWFMGEGDVHPLGYQVAPSTPGHLAIGCTPFRVADLRRACDASAAAYEGRPYWPWHRAGDARLRVRPDGSVELRRHGGWVVALYADLADEFARAHLGRTTDLGPPPLTSGGFMRSDPVYPSLRGYEVRTQGRTVMVGCVSIPWEDWADAVGAAWKGRWRWRAIGGGIGAGLVLSALGRMLVVTPRGTLAWFRWCVLSRREVLELAEHTGLR